jgi:4-hydroxythreonine-4-phosphate dehydrogenase
MRPLAITLGDPAGIGPEIVAKCFRQAPQAVRGCVVVGHLASVRRGAALTADGQPPMPVAVLDEPEQALAAPPGCIPLLAIGQSEPLPELGRPSAGGGRLAAEAVVWSARAALRGELAALVTAPLNKEALALAGVGFPGHTELLQAEAAAHLGLSAAQLPVRMMLANPELRTVLVSIHVPLREAIRLVSRESVLETIRIAQQALSRMLRRTPRIAVAGLNPHAGEGGLFGAEESLAIGPAIADAHAAGWEVHGPFAPDTVFMRARRGEFDVVVAMYHDQGLIPVKYLGVEHGVNVTLGLPLVRTSPDHGTAFDIAGTGRADPSSLLEAVRTARSLSGQD